jgi:hypothetical protein
VGGQVRVLADVGAWRARAASTALKTHAALQRVQLEDHAARTWDRTGRASVARHVCKDQRITMRQVGFIFAVRPGMSPASASMD